MCDREGDSFGATRHAELCQDVADVALDRRVAHDQVGGDLGVAEPFDQQGEDIALAGGQVMARGSRLRSRRSRFP